MTWDMGGRVALVSGGNSEIGDAIVRLLKEDGAKVAVVDTADESSASIGSAPDLYIKRNVVLQTDAVATLGEVTRQLGGIHVLVNCAGAMEGFNRMGAAGDQDWYHAYATNVRGPVNLMQACIPYFKADELVCGTINVCSVASVRGTAAGPTYTSSQHPLVVHTRQTASNYTHHRNQCAAVLVGGPGARLPCDPEEVAEGVLHLATSLSNGKVLTLDEGWLERERASLAHEGGIHCATYRPQDR